MRVVLAAALLACAVAPAFADSQPSPAPAATATPPLVLPPNFPPLSQPILPTPTAAPSDSPAPPLVLPSNFPPLSQPIIPTPTPAPTATAPPLVSPSTPPTPAPILATPPPSPSPGAVDDSVPPLYVRGQVLAIANGFFIFTSGDSLRVASGLTIPAGVTTGSYVRVSIDQLTRQIVAIALEPKIQLQGEIDAANLPRQYVVVSAKSAPLPAATGQSASAGNALVTLTVVVHVPGNTPTSDDVYLATERSNYSPAEIRMDRIDGSTFSTTVSVSTGTTLKYQFTRGTYATVERDRTGGIVPTRAVTAAPNVKTDDTVVRWADLS